MNAHATPNFDRLPSTGQPCEDSANRVRLRRFVRRLGKAASYGLANLLAVTSITLLGISAVSAQGRIALLLGAEKYQHFKPSKITVGQNQALEQALRDQGFDVKLAADPGNASARAALSEFSRKAETADFALIIASGHFATYRQQSFFLPTNARVRRATDLFSRGLSVANIADIAHRAKSGAFLMFITIPDIPSTIAGVGNQPGFARPPPANVTAVFSTSSKVPVSRVDSVSTHAMKDVIEASGKKPLMLTALLDSASAGGAGRVVGEAKELNLSQDLTKPKQVAEAEALNDTERKARILAETRLNLAEERARQAEMRAKEAEAKAKRDLAAAANAAEKRASEARRAAEEKAKRVLAAVAAEAERKAEAARKAEADRKAAEAKAAAQTPPSNPASTVVPANPAPNIQSLQVVEALLGRGQRKVIQRILKKKGYYRGPIDAVFGDQTRAAIKAFQRDERAIETGYLTPDQFQQLVASR